jgi:hypothetical protein
MTDTDKPITRQKLAIEGRSQRGRVSGKLKVALTEMIWRGSRRPEAAAIAKMSDHGLREAMRRPHVKQWYLAELALLRENERPRTFHRLCDLRDQDENKAAAVSAAKALEQLSEENAGRPRVGGVTEPGISIMIVNPPAALPGDTAKVIDAVPARQIDALGPAPVRQIEAIQEPRMEGRARLIVADPFDEPPVADPDPPLDREELIYRPPGQEQLLARRDMASCDPPPEPRPSPRGRRWRSRRE